MSLDGDPSHGAGDRLQPEYGRRPPQTRMDRPQPNAQPRPSRPTVMAAPTVAPHADPGKLTARWDKVEGAASYKVEWKESGRGLLEPTAKPPVPASSREYTISGLSAADQYVVTGDRQQHQR